MSTGRDRQLRAAAELALRLADEGRRATPPEPPPPALRRLVGFRKVTPRVLEQVRRAVDDDAEFRAKVAAAATERTVGRAGMAWLRRHEGWEEELELLTHEADELEEQRREAEAERRASRRLAVVEDAARRAEARAEAAERSAAEAKEALIEERTARRETDDARAAAAASAEDLDDQRRRAVRELEEVKGLLAARAIEVRELRAELEATRALPPEPEQASGLPRTPSSGPVASVPVEPSPTVDLEAVGRAVAAAASAANDLSAALGETARILEAGSSPPEPPRPQRRSVPRRRTPRLPGGVLEDAAEAGRHYLTIPGVICLVDGYNVSKERWPHLPIADQRRSLVECLANLAARTGADMDIVFDGMDDPAHPSARNVPSPVRVRFSAGGVEADDLILDLIDEQPIESPVVVVSSDRRVQEGARARGAAVLGSEQLLELL